jgi:hypothetical protein
LDEDEQPVTKHADNITDLTAFRERREEEWEDWGLVIAVDGSIDPVIPQQFSAAEIQDMLGLEEFALVEGWLAPGKRVAIFRNHDLGHHDLGRLKFVPFTGQPPARSFEGTNDESRYVLTSVCQP